MLIQKVNKEKVKMEEQIKKMRTKVEKKKGLDEKLSK